MSNTIFTPQHLNSEIPAIYTDWRYVKEGDHIYIPRLKQFVDVSYIKRYYYGDNDPPHATEFFFQGFLKNSPIQSLRVEHENACDADVLIQCQLKCCRSKEILWYDPQPSKI